MSDLINRQAAIDAFEALDWYHVYHGRLVHGANSDLDPVYKHDDVFKTLRALPPAQPRWILVTERLPDEWKRVLIQNDEGLFLVGFVKDRGWGKEWFYQYEMYDYDVYIESEQGKIVAWCELPDPYKGEEE